ncbi:hypothetical protein GQ44DRAFT_740522 [Phaeosphaeriaceae sp. PMI808]|nr:hypothetical protein GQ44DRAFT_740522 [Phaeosphaeriaceae sp. PMI808]
MPSHHGQKVTTDPEGTRNPIYEGVGVVTSDSLAAKSLKGDGGFGQGNPKAAISNQPSSSTNTNNTDTSSATKPDPSVDASSRKDHQGQGNQSSLQSSQGLSKESGVGPTYNSLRSSANSSGDKRGVSTGSQIGADGVRGNYALTGAHEGSGDAAREPGVKQPKGTKMDPGRVAEADFAKRDAELPGISKKGLAQDEDSKFSSLESEEA